MVVAKSSSSSGESGLRASDICLVLMSVISGPLLWWFSTAISPTSAQTALSTLEYLIATACSVIGIGICTLCVIYVVVSLLGVTLYRCGHRIQGVATLQVVPVAGRRLIATLCGINLLIASPAIADETTHDGLALSDTRAIESSPREHIAGWDVSARVSPDREHTGLHTPTDVVPGWIPNLNYDTWGDDASSDAVPDVPSKTVIVGTGECLWDIAHEELGADATIHEIDLRWRQWWSHNQDVLGPDPHTVSPGTVLSSPPFRS
ncbi:LysM peptidoglycan-binding domain-containing protein [Auritidibacter ignavus]|uniref:LysM peptidoglycan-binding domain-containing protein n=1 Tax=Auritidibacter ignavus TaxID=678932 RepID=UPI00109C5974|nr:hypothetical protein [Auritidibacter ignavus]